MSVVRVTVPVVTPPPAATIPTTRFGVLTVPPEEIYAMPEGMHGFPDLARFVLIAPEPGSLFYWWQSAEAPELAFPLLQPATIFPDFGIEVDESDVLRLQLGGRTELHALCVVTVPPQQPEHITVNLLAPLVLDPVAREAWQLICERSDHRIAVPLLPALEAWRAAAASDL